MSGRGGGRGSQGGGRGSSHARPRRPTQSVYVAGPADRAGTRSISEYFVRDQSLPKPPAASARVSGSAQQATLSASSGAAATGEGVVTALVSAAGAVLNSAAQAVSEGLWSLPANYGLSSDDEGDKGEPIDVDV